MECLRTEQQRSHCSPVSVGCDSAKVFNYPFTRSGLRQLDRQGSEMGCFYTYLADITPDIARAHAHEHLAIQASKSAEKSPVMMKHTIVPGLAVFNQLRI